MIKYSICFLQCCAVLAAVLYSYSTKAGEAEDSVAALEQQISFLKYIETFAEPQDVGRLHLLAKVSKKVKILVKTQGLSNRETFRAYDVLIITYQSSSNFLDSIATDRSKSAIESLQKTTDGIVEKIGEPAGSKITHMVFVEFKEKLDDLAKLNMSKDLSAKITSLLPGVGRTIAVADQDFDTPPTYDLSVPLAQRVADELYPLLREISAGEEGFRQAVDIMGLIEFYLEFVGK